jgi:hypothetical protein
MPDNQPREIVPSRGGIFHDLLQRIKLVIRLMTDARVSLVLKLLPAGSLAYLILPDLIPTPIDDAAIIWLGTYLFVELCPPHIVEEHLAYLKRANPTYQTSAASVQEDDDIIDAEFREEI